MKREIKSFTVEVRQPKRRSLSDNSKTNWVSAGLVPRPQESAASLEAAAAFRPATVETAPVAAAPPARSGRILPILAEASAAPEPQPVALEVRTARALRNTPSLPSAAATPKAATRARAPRKAPPEVEPAPVAPPPPRPETENAEPSPRARKRAILERYVFGRAVKPGEGWKRRQRSRRAERE